MPGRLPMFDALKGFAILMVVYTHVLQYAGIGYFLDNPFFKFTYAFHMPLFMVISGYFSASSLQLSFPGLLKKKAVELLLPCLTTGALVLALNLLFHFAPQYARPTYLLFNLWYLKSLFGCYVAAWLSLYLTRGKLPAAIILSLTASLFLPGIFHWPFMLPFFWLGFIWRKSPDWFVRNGKWAGIAGVGIFVALWPLWDGKMSVYFTPLELIDYHRLTWAGANLLPHILRLMIGLAGTVATISLFTWLYRRGKSFRPLEKLGRYTLEIYALHFILIHLALYRYITIPYVGLVYELLYCPLITALVFVLCLLCIRIIGSNRFTELIFFGKKSVSR